MTEWPDGDVYLKLLAGKPPEDLKALYEQNFAPPTDVFLAGYRAAEDGQLRSSCPFRSHQTEWDEWMRGWDTFRKTIVTR